MPGSSSLVWNMDGDMFSFAVDVVLWADSFVYMCGVGAKSIDFGGLLTLVYQ